MKYISIYTYTCIYQDKNYQRFVHLLDFQVLMYKKVILKANVVSGNHFLVHMHNSESFCIYYLYQSLVTWRPDKVTEYGDWRIYLAFLSARSFKLSRSWKVIKVQLIINGRQWAHFLCLIIIIIHFLWDIFVYLN